MPPIRVLVVDDSAYVRKMVREMLARHGSIDVVGTARDGEEALRLVEDLRPDVVTTDLIMPGVDGVEFVRRQMAIRPLPIVVVSIAPESSERVLAALDAGAIDFVQKPTALATEKIADIAGELIDKVVTAAGASLTSLQPPATPREISPPADTGWSKRYDLVVIGVSTGGPQGLKAIVPALPATFPVPVAIVLHMPVGYTEGYARRLDELSSLTVVEAQGGEALRPGTVYVAPAGRHLTFRRKDPDRVVMSLDLQPLDTPHRPAVDVLFRSAADVFGDRVLAVVMTGMGADGREGAAWIKARGGTVLTEAESSCVVYGMPRAVVEAGLSDEAVPLERLAHSLGERV
jgi:two-component system, chemotaxis family, protein-glutamate methylesterase/glutaminase